MALEYLDELQRRDPSPLVRTLADMIKEIVQDLGCEAAPPHGLNCRLSAFDAFQDWLQEQDPSDTLPLVRQTAVWLACPQPDADGDGMGDAWQRYFQKKSNAVLRALDDLDCDELSNVDEFRWNYIPLYSVPIPSKCTDDIIRGIPPGLVVFINGRDYDLDGFLDGEEVRYWNDPSNDALLYSSTVLAGQPQYAWRDPDSYLLDTDKDGIPNAHDDDSDNDGILDGHEIHVYGTYPEFADSDCAMTSQAQGKCNPPTRYLDNPKDPLRPGTGDGFPDGEELAYWNSLDQRVAKFYPWCGLEGAWSCDLDGDGIWNNLLDPDADGDGLRDGDEHQGIRGCDGRIHVTHAYRADSDADGLSDFRELFVYCTDPRNPDTDGDLMPDGWEVRHGLNPLDAADADGDLELDRLANWREYCYPMNQTPCAEHIPTIPEDGMHQSRLDALNVDSDADGLRDGDEYYDYGTEPNLWDTDFDCMGDGWEVQYGLNPLNDTDAGGDLDGDGLNNCHEAKYKTNPTNVDSDGDGMWDGWEPRYGLHPLDPSDGPLDPDGDGLSNRGEFEFGTNPRRWDTDGDRLSDGDEAMQGTDPAKRDTDGDGIDDFADGRPAVEDVLPLIETIHFLRPARGFRFNATDNANVASVRVDAHYRQAGSLIVTTSSQPEHLNETTYEFLFDQASGEAVGFNITVVDVNENEFEFGWIFGSASGPETVAHTESGANFLPSRMGAHFQGRNMKYADGHASHVVACGPCVVAGAALVEKLLVAAFGLFGAGWAIYEITKSDGSKERREGPIQTEYVLNVAVQYAGASFGEVVMDRQTWNRIERLFPAEVTLDDLGHALRNPIRAIAVESGKWLVVAEFAAYHAKGRCILKLILTHNAGSRADLTEFDRFCRSDESPFGTGANWEKIVWFWWTTAGAVSLQETYEFLHKVPARSARPKAPNQMAVFVVDAKTGDLFPKGWAPVPPELLEIGRQSFATDAARRLMESTVGAAAFHWLHCVEQSWCPSTGNRSEDATWYWGELWQVNSRRHKSASWAALSGEQDWRIEWAHGPRDLMEVQSAVVPAFPQSSEKARCVDPLSCSHVAYKTLGRAEKAIMDAAVTTYSAYLPTAIVWAVGGVSVWIETAQKFEEFRFGDH